LKYQEAAAVSDEPLSLELLGAGGVAVLSAGFVSSVLFESEIAEFFPRLSVTYQPLPLKTTGGAWRTRFATPLPHSSHVCVVSAEKLWRSSYVLLHAEQWYS